MSLFGSQIEQKGGFFPHHSHSLVFSNSYGPSVSPSLSYSSDDYQKQSPSSGNRVSPAILFIIVVLAVVFFISGILHLLVRFLMKHRPSSTVSQSSRYPDVSGSDAFQRQLQQLFHLHDSGLDQALIDALPAFVYEEIVGRKELFDCAVCLCEFSEKDKLRLLPMCSHAFHIDCIDTWLLSNSSCPLCRGTLFTIGASFENPVFEFEGIREEEGVSSNSGGNIPFVGQNQKPAEAEVANSISRRVFSVRLGKFWSSNYSGEATGRGEGESSCSSSLDARRCYSMGSCQYVVSELDLQVAFSPSKAAAAAAAPEGSFKLLKGRVNGNYSSTDGDVDGKKLNSRSKGESFSVSKVWQWSRKGKFPDSSVNNMGLQWNNRTHAI